MTGTLFGLGVGPGDPDLLTLRALHALQGADVVFYDDLVTPEILDRARRDAERVFVGKRRDAPGIGQDEINRLLRDAARGGRNVVRLKGGDPFVFGRGGEEVRALAAANIRFRVVPGVTAGIGGLAYAGIPATSRETNQALILVAVDVSGRPFSAVDLRFHGERVGTLPTELIEHFLSSFATEARITLHVRELAGRNDHHRAEAAFKALARALGDATALDPRQADRVPSTKETLVD